MPGSPFPVSLLFQVGEVYRQLHAAMSQAPVKKNIPYSWASLACVKAHHYGALAHYFAATLLIDHQRKARGLRLWAALRFSCLGEILSSVRAACLPWKPGQREGVMCWPRCLSAGQGFVITCSRCGRKTGSGVLPGMEQTASWR